MQFLTSINILLAALGPVLSSPILSDLGQQPIGTKADFKIPTVHESAILARRILRLSPIGTLSTNLPNSGSHAQDYPIGMPDYIADCDPTKPGSPTVLALNIATSFRNIAAGSHISLSLRYEPPASVATRYTVASLPRFSLMAKLEDIPEEEVKEGNVVQCFTKRHPDAKWWLPGNHIHTSRWTRLVVTDVYWVGGFGDRAYIGWIPTETWSNVTEAEIASARLPGEEP
ncbi:hypothetical protein DRE_04313 [Drechslerella stenobrocha 248]|uniref:CREG-like beta-barrel domain-containing protein n=1 Tax=Drechslerella stenobrocha 248 TaxID=1043628 RepID=W7IB95_9PEZI|nr:hypothetical protein DRE_04313 [Drechslerella stenobrocha 248]